jgi:hypothetical protein
MPEEQEQQERKRKNLIDMLADVELEGVNISSMSISELEEIETLHKAYNIEYNRQRPIPLGTNPSQSYIEQRQAYVNHRLKETYSRQKRQ